MRAAPFMEYALAKVRDSAMRDNYLYDCLWALAADMRFSSEKKPTMQRWHDIAYPKRANSATPLTKEAVKRQFLRLKRER